jgi:hypothetical protein
MATPNPAPSGTSYSYADGMAELSNSLRLLEREVKILRSQNAAMRSQLQQLGVVPVCDLPGQLQLQFQGHQLASPGALLASLGPLQPQAQSPMSPYKQLSTPVSPGQRARSPSRGLPELSGRKLVFDLSRRESPDEMRFLGLPLLLESQIPEKGVLVWPGDIVPIGHEPERLCLFLDSDSFVRKARYG